MTACQAERKVSVNPRLQRALAANFTTKAATRHVTAVALIRPVGMLQKHARDSISRSNIPPEKSMPFAKQLSKELSCHQSHSQIRLPRQIDRSAVSVRPSNSDRPLLTSSQEDASQPAILEALPRLMVKAVARFAEHAGTAFPNLLLAIAEFLAGCAAYAEAMYPPPPMADERVHSGVPVPTACPTLDILPLKGKPSLIAIAGNRNRSIGSKELCFRLEQTGPVAGAQADAENMAWPMKGPDAGSPWPVSIIAPAISLLARLRRAQAQRQAIVELRGLDDRTLRDIGISRCNVEHIASDGACRE
jgi:uncharacterized protein YjiS (DUF1127 family)